LGKTTNSHTLKIGEGSWTKAKSY